MVDEAQDPMPIFQVQVRAGESNLERKTNRLKAMYSMLPLTKLPPIPLQDVVYEMRNIHDEPFPGCLAEFFHIGLSAMDERDNVTEEFCRLLEVFRFVLTSSGIVSAVTPSFARPRSLPKRADARGKSWPATIMRTSARHDDSSRKFPRALIRDRPGAERRSDVLRFLSVSFSLSVSLFPSVLGLDRCSSCLSLGFFFLECLERERITKIREEARRSKITRERAVWISRGGELFDSRAKERRATPIVDCDCQKRKSSE